MSKLREESYRWAIAHLFKESDTDLFPRPLELSIINELEEELIGDLVDIDLTNYKWQAARRFIVPKEDLAYRNATQLHPIDSILLAGIIYEYGHLIEARRAGENTVFSYRFNPITDGTLYANKNAWNKFWKACQEEIAEVRRTRDEEDDESQFEYTLTSDYPFVVTCDISDFYNQIYLHTIENQLIDCGFPNAVKNAIKSLLVHLNENSSRGLPIGPHSTHLLAEMSLIPVDNSLNFQGIHFKRYVDDVVFFCRTEKEARIIVQQFAEILDKEQRMVLQKQKTRIYSEDDFLELTQKMLIEQPAYESEREILEVIRSYTSGDPYLKINLDNIDEDDLMKLSQDNIVSLLEEYVKKKNFEKLRWIYRRLAQIGIPHAVDFSIENFENIIPALPDVCQYINACAPNYKADWKTIGEEIFYILEDEMVEANPFYQISILNLFVYNPSLNHINKLVQVFKKSNEEIKRKILLSCTHYRASAAWIYEQKEDQQRFSDWTRRAYMIATKSLPADQKKYLHGSIKATLDKDAILERLILTWAK